jgi:hypothetical protein
LQGRDTKKQYGVDKGDDRPFAIGEDSKTFHDNSKLRQAGYHSVRLRTTIIVPS